MNVFATLISFTPSTGTLTYSVNGVTQTSRVVSATVPHRAALERFAPTDPIRPIVTRWNTLISTVKGPITFGSTTSDVLDTFASITADLAANDAKVQIHLKPNSDTVASIRPIPFLPPHPI
ncbi:MULTISPECIES: hypothetical protein [Neobacillus]|uniref:Uncharacterized protein n=1 Tax=Neobacillus citreus TaxID=2833578 RepID=A0A9J6MYN7_9BACI|nr:hypothetical protein [Neobacillus citreus]MCH6264902.1 hypothetical protein [Neobacillus citreus]